MTGMNTTHAPDAEQQRIHLECLSFDAGCRQMIREMLTQLIDLARKQAYRSAATANQRPTDPSDLRLRYADERVADLLRIAGNAAGCDKRG